MQIRCKLRLLQRKCLKAGQGQVKIKNKRNKRMNKENKEIHKYIEYLPYSI